MSFSNDSGELAYNCSVSLHCLKGVLIAHCFPIQSIIQSVSQFSFIKIG